MSIFLKVLVLDNNSPFTSDILNLLDKLFQKYECKKCLEAPNPLPYDRIILSGRKKNDKRINAMNSSIIRFCHSYDKPLLGICYGAEIIALTFGGSIRRIQQVIGMTKINIHIENDLIKSEGIWEVYEGHSYNIARLPKEFVSVASSQFSKYEIFCHSKKKIYGTQFHPERSGELGLKIFRNFLNI
ncbi:MAG: gamma-glutamyl-gamma-aminobutyrate hydrolase family protein [Thermoproteota archaeon]|nr:gamma-glutamyl-gamma-aminobutyrate hydrolase family protein [Thermoproteota archaeon]